MTLTEELVQTLLPMMQQVALLAEQQSEAIRSIGEKYGVEGRELAEALTEASAIMLQAIGVTGACERIASHFPSHEQPACEHPPRQRPPSHRKGEN